MDIDFINNPHDKFFKETFTKRENAVSFLKNYLPKKIRNLINPDKIKIEKDSFISDVLKENFSDILYRVDIKGKESYIYTLFEHKSNPEINTGLQLLEYMVKIWQAKKRQDEELPIVIPIVVYQGQDDWKISTQFSDLLNVTDENLLRYTPDFEYILKDLSQYDDKDILGTDELRARLKLMKHIKDRIENIINQYREEQILSKLISAAVYIYAVREEDIDKIVQKINKISKQGGQTMKTIAEKLIEKGKIEGKTEGWEEGKVEIAKNMIVKGMSIEDIADITGLSLETVKKIKKYLS